MNTAYARATRGTIIGVQYHFQVEYWTKVDGLDHKITGPHYFNDLVEAEDWLRENWEQLKSGDGLSGWWNGCEMRSWDLSQA